MWSSRPAWKQVLDLIMLPRESKIFLYSTYLDWISKCTCRCTNKLGLTKLNRSFSTIRKVQFSQSTTLHHCCKFTSISLVLIKHEMYLFRWNRRFIPFSKLFREQTPVFKESFFPTSVLLHQCMVKLKRPYVVTDRQYLSPFPATSLQNFANDIPQPAVLFTCLMFSSFFIWASLMTGVRMCR